MSSTGTVALAILALRNHPLQGNLGSRQLDGLPVVQQHCYGAIINPIKLTRSTIATRCQEVIRVLHRIDVLGKSSNQMVLVRSFAVMPWWIDSQCGGPERKPSDS